jgi:hypothetical protein
MKRKKLEKLAFRFNEQKSKEEHIIVNGIFCYAMFRRRVMSKEKSRETKIFENDDNIFLIISIQALTKIVNKVLS